MSKASAMAADVQLEVVGPAPTMPPDCADDGATEVVVVVVVLEVKVVIAFEMVVVVGVVVEIVSAVNDDDIGTFTRSVTGIIMLLSKPTRSDLVIAMGRCYVIDQTPSSVDVIVHDHSTPLPGT